MMPPHNDSTTERHIIQLKIIEYLCLFITRYLTLGDFSKFDLPTDASLAVSFFSKPVPAGKSPKAQYFGLF